MKTVSVALVLCLNVGVDPPDVVKTSPCARLECWIGEWVHSDAHRQTWMLGDSNTTWSERKKDLILRMIHKIFLVMTLDFRCSKMTTEIKILKSWLGLKQEASEERAENTQITKECKKQFTILDTSDTASRLLSSLTVYYIAKQNNSCDQPKLQLWLHIDICHSYPLKCTHNLSSIYFFDLIVSNCFLSKSNQPFKCFNHRAIIKMYLNRTFSP